MSLPGVTFAGAVVAVFLFYRRCRHVRYCCFSSVEFAAAFVVVIAVVFFVVVNVVAAVVVAVSGAAAVAANAAAAVVVIVVAFVCCIVAVVKFVVRSSVCEKLPLWLSMLFVYFATNVCGAGWFVVGGAAVDALVCVSVVAAAANVVRAAVLAVTVVAVAAGVAGAVVVDVRVVVADFALSL